MKCKWVKDGTHAATGWTLYRCAECGNVVPSPYPPEKIRSRCGRWPKWHQFGEWVALVAERFKLPGNCGGCEDRKQLLNEIGERLRS